MFRRPAAEYADPVRRRRAAIAVEACRPVHGSSFGDERFLALIGEGGWDLLCHHAADVTNYKSPDFDTVAALANNTHKLPAVLGALEGRRLPPGAPLGQRLRGGRGRRLAGPARLFPLWPLQGPDRAGLPLRNRRAGVGLGKFVIPNPFGPYEEPRFTAYLMKNWLAGATPNCSSPAYVRDNIHASLLAGRTPASPAGCRPRDSPGPIPADTPRARALHAPPGPGDAPGWGSPAPSS